MLLQSMWRLKLVDLSAMSRLPGSWGLGATAAHGAHQVPLSGEVLCSRQADFASLTARSPARDAHLVSVAATQPPCLCKAATACPVLGHMPDGYMPGVTCHQRHRPPTSCLTLPCRYFNTHKVRARTGTEADQATKKKKGRAAAQAVDETEAQLGALC